MLLCAAAMAVAHNLGWAGEERTVTETELTEVTEDFALCMLKTLDEIAPARMSDQVRGRMVVLDRAVKRRRNMPAEGGTA